MHGTIRISAPSPGRTGVRPSRVHAAPRASPRRMLQGLTPLLKVPRSLHGRPGMPSPQRNTVVASQTGVTTPESFTTTLAYEVVQGTLVRWTQLDTSSPPPPTAVLVHGILGSRRNLASFAQKLAVAFPAWQFLLVDLRCHGDSAALPHKPDAPHNVDTAAADILALLGNLKLFPRVLIGHSFGGKVAMSMVGQFGAQSRGVLPRPVHVWVLDTVPGSVDPAGPSRKDHPADLIKQCKEVSIPVQSRSELVDHLTKSGFSTPIARWMTTNLQADTDVGGLRWTFDLDGIEEMYSSYESSNMWPVLEETPQGAMIEFVRAEHSTFRWLGGNQERIESLGARVHLLENSGHWVHADSPDGLFRIIAPSLSDLSGRV